MKSLSSFSTSLVAIFVALFSLSIAGQSHARLAGAQPKQRSSQEQQLAGDMILHGNKNVYQYTARDLKAVDTPASFCPKIELSPNGGDCMTFSSTSNRAIWKVRFVRNGRAEAIFKVENGKAVPWVYFEENGTVVYLSEIARQRYAGNNRQSGSINGGGVTQPQAGDYKECHPRYIVTYGARECSDQRKRGSGVVENPRTENPDIGSLLGKELGKALNGILQQGR